MNTDLKQKLIAATGLGMELIGLVWVCFYIGRYFDRKYELPGYGVTFGGLLALIAWMAHVVVIVRDLSKSDGDDNGKNPPNQ